MDPATSQLMADYRIWADGLTYGSVAALWDAQQGMNLSPRLDCGDVFRGPGEESDDGPAGLSAGASPLSFGAPSPEHGPAIPSGGRSTRADRKC